MEQLSLRRLLRFFSRPYMNCVIVCEPYGPAMRLEDLAYDAQSHNVRHAGGLFGCGGYRDVPVQQSDDFAGNAAAVVRDLKTDPFRVRASGNRDCTALGLCRILLWSRLRNALRIS